MAQPTSEITTVDLRGLDLSSPYDMVQKNRSPHARNFRLYSEERDDRRVAVSSRKGSGMYINPLGETQNVSNTNAATGQALVGIFTNWQAQSFVPSSNGLLTRVDLELSNTLASSGSIVVEIRANNAGVPGVKIADTGILSSHVTSTSAFVSANVIEAPSVTTANTYWIVAYVQDDLQLNTLETYNWSRNATGNSMTSNSAGNTWSANGFGLKFKTWVSTDVRVKGMARYTPDNGQNRTVLAIGTTMYLCDDGSGTMTSIDNTLNALATDYSFAQMDNKLFWVNGYDQLKTWNGTTVETITHAQLPLLSMIAVNKSVLWGVSASDPNKLIYSQTPGDNDGSGNVWYKAYLSTSIGYVPAPHANDPITAICSFQDTLTVFTATTKWVVYGSNSADIQPRQSTGIKGAVSQRGIHVSKDFIYFVSDDGFYQYNGTQDELISDTVQPEFANIADIRKVCVAEWKRTIRFYYPTTGSSRNNQCLIWHTVYKEWMLDTDTYVSFALGLKDSNDPKNLLEVSSVVSACFWAEQEYSNLGKAIDFQYHLNYNSYKNPGRQKRITKLYPLLQGATGDYPVSVKMDKDMEDAPREYVVPLRTAGLKIGMFKFGDGSKLGGGTSFRPVRLRVSGYGYYHQIRVERKAINNPVKFMGYQLAFRTKKL